MKKAFVRALWGNFWDDSDTQTIRREKITRDIDRVCNSKYQMDFTVYVFGDKNYGFVNDLLNSYDSNSKWDVVLADARPILWDMGQELYRHKLEAVRCAMKDFDKIVFLDWDCILMKELSEDVWDILGECADVQANLFQYRTKKCLWRDVDPRKTCNGGFIYIADKSIPDQLIDNWNEFKIQVDAIRKKRGARGLEIRLREKSLVFDDEPSISKYIDDICGGWPGIDEYWRRFEPKVCNLRKKSVYTQEQNESKNEYFRHML